ncbi:MAG: shikimate dehydrogenase [Flavobacteriaceae bacterium]|nr:shikimate dehydrogenase [Flavobacteriaceae bacterium]MDZ4147775.1 shikimate dehydrogenase [Flavobacteriaceae bacterium]
MRSFGLIGRNISYSFSVGYFTEKFRKEGITDCTYENFDLQDISEFPKLIQSKPNLIGLNITIPYKEQVIPYLNELHETAAEIGAVNTIKITSEGNLIGYNTDYYGFQKSIEPYLKPTHKHALILGTGGASKAVAYALKKSQINAVFVSRNNLQNGLTYSDLTKDIVDSHLLIINCTPLGTFPNVENKPDFPYQFLTPKHLLYDLIYNPAETAFLKMGKAKGASICNGLEMLVHQAEKAWKIWES